MRAWWTRFRLWISGRHGMQEDLDEEIRTHYEMEAEDRGADPVKFGNRTAIAEAARDAWGFPSLESILQDTRYALRGLRRSPGFTAVVVLTLALGIGLNTAIFSVVHAVLLKPLPYPDSERLVWLGESAGPKVRGISVTWVNYQHWLRENHTFDDLAAFEFAQPTLTGRGEAVVTRGRVVTSNYFALTGMRPLVGRLFDATDDKPGAAPVVVLNHRFWVDKFGADPNVAGSALTLNGKQYEIAGVAAPVWESLSSDFFLPLGMIRGSTVDRSQHASMRVLGKLKRSVPLATAIADLDSIMQRLAQSNPGPENEHRSYGEILADSTTGSARLTLLILLGATGLVLLIGCANVAGLVLARNTTRAAEFSIRASIGAGRMRLLRQVFTENLVLAVAGGIGGAVLAYWSLPLLLAAAPPVIPRLAETAINPAVLAFAAGLTLITSLAAGLAPMLSVRSAAGVGSRVVGGRSSIRSVLVIAEVALTLVLTFTSGLLLRSLAAAQNAEPGFDPRDVVAIDLPLPASTYSTEAQRQSFSDRLTASLRSLPGVSGVSSVHCRPGGGTCRDWFYSVPGRPAPPSNEVPIAVLNAAAPDYFRTLRIPILQGREFTEADRGGGPLVAIVNETLARTWWPNESPLGHQIKYGGPYREGPVLEIVGVVADVKQGGLDSEPKPEIYEPLAQSGRGRVTFLIRGKVGGSVIRRAVAETDRNLPVQGIVSLEETLGASLERRRFSTVLLGLFAGLAMSLASVGIYGLLSYWVSVREPEIAVRLALGARPNAILLWTSRYALQLAAAGVLCGALAGWWASRLLEDLVFGIRSFDPTTLAGAAAVVALIAVLAAAIPAWRASRVDVVTRLYRA